MSPRVYLGLLPWIVFAIVGHGSLEGAAWAAAAALAAAVVILVMSARTHAVKDVEIFAVALFTALMLWGASDQHDAHGILQRYHSGIATGALACYAIASLAWQPFTEPYAREVVQKKYWKTARFTRANVELTLMWAAVFAAVAASQAAAGAIQTRLGSTVFTWVLPMALVLLGAQQATMRWHDQFDGESMSLDAVFNQVELWRDAPGPETPNWRAEHGQL
jgi:hypothetical protein